MNRTISSINRTLIAISVLGMALTVLVSQGGLWNGILAATTDGNSNRILNYAAKYGGIGVGGTALIYLLALRILGARDGFDEIASLGIGLFGFWCWYVELLNSSSLIPAMITMTSPAIVLIVILVKAPNDAVLDFDKSEIVLSLVLSIWITISVMQLTILGQA